MANGTPQNFQPEVKLHYRKRAKIDQELDKSNAGCFTYTCVFFQSLICRLLLMFIFNFNLKFSTSRRMNERTTRVEIREHGTVLLNSTSLAAAAATTPSRINNCRPNYNQT